MAKISKRQVYVPKKILFLRDYFVITDWEDNLRTKTTEFKNVLTALNTANGKTTLNYQFSTVVNADINLLTEGFFFSESHQTNPLLITKLSFNKENLFEIDCKELFSFIVNENVFVLKLVNSQDPNNIIYLKPTGIVLFDEYFDVTVEHYNEIYNGPLVDESIYSIDFEFIPVEQNNTWREVYLGTYDVNGPEEGFDNLFNQELLVSDTENIMLTWTSYQGGLVEEITPAYHRYKWARGKGTWNPIPHIVGQDILFESASQATSGDIITIINGANTQTYDLGDITGDTLVENINSTGPYDLTDPAKTYLFLYESDGVTYLYQFIGTNGDYGDGETAITETDLLFITSSAIPEVVVPTKTSDLENTGENGIDPFITAVALDPIETEIENIYSILGTDNNNGFLGQASVVWTGVGFIYDVIYPSYKINGVTYPAGTDTITLDASDPTFLRIDVVGVDAAGVIVETGTPAADPIKPTLNPETQLEITPIFVLPGTTEPVVDSSLIFNENTEWTTSSNNGSVDFESTLNPFIGLLNIDAPAMVVNQFLKFENAVELDVVNYNFLRFYINLKGTWTNSNAFDVRFYKNGVAVSNLVTVQNGVFNFSRTIINTYQTVAIAMSNFTFTSGSFDEVRLIIKNSLAFGFRMDYIQLLGGGGSISNLQNTLTTIITDAGTASVTQPNDVFKIVGAGTTNVSATGKTITVETNFDPSDYSLDEFGNPAVNPFIRENDINVYYRGKYTSLANLEAAIPTGNDGDYAIVDAGSGTDAIQYIWDSDEGWLSGGTAGAADTDALPEGSTNLYFTVARVLATVLTGISFATGTAVVGTDTVLEAFGKLQKQISDLVSGKLDNPTGTPDGTKFLADDNTWKNVTSNSDDFALISSFKSMYNY